MKAEVIMFIHGFLGNINEFDLLKDFFIENGYQTHTFYLSGHDKEDLDEMTRKKWIDSCNKNIEFLIEKGYKRIIIVGHSMGGVLGIDVANRYDEVSKVILFDPCLEYFIMKKGKLKIFPSIKPFNIFIKEVIEMGDKNKINKLSISIFNEFKFLIKEHKEDIYKLKKPILLLHGEKDSIVPIKRIRQIFEELDNSRKIFIEIKGGSHWIVSTKLEDVVYEKILKFIKE